MNPYSSSDLPPGTEALPTSSDIAPNALEKAVPNVFETTLESNLPSLNDETMASGAHSMRRTHSTRPVLKGRATLAWC
jgi:hypothetical protein